MLRRMSLEIVFIIQVCLLLHVRNRAVMANTHCIYQAGKRKTTRAMRSSIVGSQTRSPIRKIQSSNMASRGHAAISQVMLLAVLLQNIDL